MTNISLWPDTFQTSPKPLGPTELLREQADLLGEKTNGVVKAQVNTEVDERNSTYFVDRFVLYSPSLNYRYPLFSVRYTARSFPQRIEWWAYDSQIVLKLADEEEVIDGVKQVWDEEELSNELRLIFSHQDTLQIIQNLIARNQL